MILYKNLYPTDFSLLHQNKGVVYETFISTGLLKDEIKKDDWKRLEEIDLEIHAISEETLRSIEELRAVIVGKFLKLWPGLGWEIYCDDNKTDISSLFSEENIQNILTGKIYFRDSRYRNSFIRPKVDEIKSSLGESYNYSQRKHLIQSIADDKIEDLKDERKAFMDDISAMEKYTLVDIAKLGRNIFEHVNITKGQEKKYEVLKYLLEKGYIDEKYFFYLLAELI